MNQRNKNKIGRRYMCFLKQLNTTLQKQDPYPEPTEIGWYWWLKNGYKPRDAAPIHVIEDLGMLYARDNDWDLWELKDYTKAGTWGTKIDEWTP